MIGDDRPDFDDFEEYHVNMGCKQYCAVSEIAMSIIFVIIVVFIYDNNKTQQQELLYHYSFE